MNAAEKFIEPLFREFEADGHSSHSRNIIKASKASLAGRKKVSVDEESLGGIKIVVERNERDEIREIKFFCSCGQTKSIVLDYND